MNEIAEARKKERLDQLKKLPLAVVFFVLICGLYVVMVNEQLTFLGFTIWGVSKNIWFLVVFSLAGIAAVSIAYSFTFLVFVGIVAKRLKKSVHPWKPLIFSGKLLVFSYFTLALCSLVELSIRENISQINNWYDYRIGDGVLNYVLAGFWWIAITNVSMLVVSQFIQAVSLPFNTKDLVK